MNDQPTDLDRAEEQILASTLSDEALEAAAGASGGTRQTWGVTVNPCNYYC
jgi:hypothetical protein